MVAGSLTYDTKMDTTGFQKGINDITNTTKKGGSTIKNIVAGLGITKIISTAISTIKSSIDGAVKRVDVLNNFPKVMENLGISSEKSEVSIRKISDGLKGLPTTLNDGALAVQRFTSTNGDVEKSTDYFLALNNAILAGGAGTELQASALEQLSQAYSKGKPDMMEWRTLMMAMPAQLKQIATSLGYVNTDDLYEGFKDGSVSMEMFMDEIVKLNKNGTGEFLSFEKQAKNAVGGIGTSITNAKTAVTRGVANIVDAIDKSLKEEGFGGIGKVISDIGKVAEGVLSNVAKFAGAVIKALRGIIDWISQNQGIVKAFASVILGVVAGLVAYKTALNAIKSINIAKNILSTINPLALLVASITAVVTAVAAFVNSSKRVNEELKETYKNAEEQRKSWNDLKDARKNALETSEKEIGVTQKLADELREITDENGKVKEGYENRAKYILGELNKALGTEYKMNDNIIQDYQEMKENLDKLIQSKRAEAALNAYKGEYEEAIKKQSEATKTLVDLRKQLADAEKTVTKNALEEESKRKAIEGLNEAIKSQTDLIGEYGYTIDKYEKLTSASVSDSAEEIDGALKDMTTSYDEAKTKLNTSLGSQLKSQGDYVKRLKAEWEKAKNNNDKYQEQILKKQLDTQRQELDNLATSLAEQTSTIDELSPDIVEAWKDLASNSEEAYAEALKKVPPETAKRIQEATGIVVKDTGLQNASAQEGKDATSAYSNNLKYKTATKVELINTKDAIKNNTSIQNASEKLGARTDRGFDRNISLAQDMAAKIRDAATKVRENEKLPNAGENLAKRLKGRFNNIVSAYTWGQEVAENLAHGMQSKEELVGIAAGSLAGIVASHIHFSEPDVGPLSNFHTFMPDMIDLMVKGIDNNRYKVTSAVVGLTKGMQQQMQEAVKLEQTNKYMKSYLENMVTSMNILINTSKVKISSAIEALSKSIKSGMNTMMSSININSYITKAINSMTLSIDKYKKKLTSAMVVLSRDTQQKLQNAVSLNVQDMNTKSVINSNNMYNSVIKLNASFNGVVEMDGEKTGRIVTPYVTRTIKAGGAY